MRINLSVPRFLILGGPTSILQNEIALVQNWIEKHKRLAPPDPQ
jgi:hypothetical protein